MKLCGDFLKVVASGLLVFLSWCLFLVSIGAGAAWIVVCYRLFVLQFAPIAQRIFG